MGPFLSNFEIMAFVGALAAYWFGAAVTLTYFARARRSRTTKIKSLVIPFVTGTISAIIGLASYDESFAVFIPSLAIACASLGFLTTFAFAHTLAFVFRRDAVVYGLCAAFVIASPFTGALRTWNESRRHEIAASNIRHAAEPAIALCCAHNAQGCRDTADAFDRLFEVTGYSGRATDLRNKYYGQACKIGTAADCRTFMNSVGASEDDYKNARLYQEPCDTRDLYFKSEPRVQSSEEF